MHRYGRPHKAQTCRIRKYRRAAFRDYQDPLFFSVWKNRFKEEFFKDVGPSSKIAFPFEDARRFPWRKVIAPVKAVYGSDGDFKPIRQTFILRSNIGRLDEVADPLRIHFGRVERDPVWSFLKRFLLHDFLSINVL